MKPEERLILVELRDLLAFQRDRAVKHELSEVTITLPRATALINQINAVLKPKQNKPEPSWVK